MLRAFVLSLMSVSAVSCYAATCNSNPVSTPDYQINVIDQNTVQIVQSCLKGGNISLTLSVTQQDPKLDLTKYFGGFQSDTEQVTYNACGMFTSKGLSMTVSGKLSGSLKQFNGVWDAVTCNQVIRSGDPTDTGFYDGSLNGQLSTTTANGTTNHVVSVNYSLLKNTPSQTVSSDTGLSYSSGSNDSDWLSALGDLKAGTAAPTNAQIQQVFTLIESRLPDYFKSSTKTGTTVSSGYTLKYYDLTNSYLGVKDSTVYHLSKLSGGKVAAAGTVDQLIYILSH